MKRIKKRRKHFRISNPLGFSLFCAICILAVGLVVGIICLAVGYGQDAIAFIKAQLNGTPVSVQATLPSTAEPTDTPVPTESPIETPDIGTPVPETPTPEPLNTPEPVATTPAPDPKEDPNAPLYGFTIGIDPTRDVDSKYKEECAYNLEIAQKLKAYLESKGATVVLTREDNKTDIGNNSRAKIIKKAKCDIAIRLMCNHISSKSSGCFVQYLKKNKNYAKALINAYSEATGIKKQSGKSGGIENKSDTVASECGCPCVLLVMGNWDNKTERANLQDEAFQEKMIGAIYETLLARLKR
ncbi:MAG: N-acetylmuramoyl-L-alanine amidase [Clostridia bacterium]|nr:N-acetylmuramoyl-L-alanine amidase [Clostridia bacterium]